MFQTKYYQPHLLVLSVMLQHRSNAALGPVVAADKVSAGGAVEDRVRGSHS
jgi:hypothetical protein